MKQDNETRNRLLQSAKKEFTEKGYMNASLRSICKNANVTTGALYFFFKDKNDLFEELTKNIVTSLFQLMQEHFQTELLETKHKIEEVGQEMSVSKMVLHQMYLQREDILLVITKSQGSSMECVVDKFVEETVAHYYKLAELLQKKQEDIVIDKNFIHWFAHMQIDSFIYMITHIEEEKEAVSYMEKVVQYMVNGWNNIFEI